MAPISVGPQDAAHPSCILTHARMTLQNPKHSRWIPPSISSYLTAPQSTRCFPTSAWKQRSKIIKTVASEVRH